jgi:hypothetical protein
MRSGFRVAAGRRSFGLSSMQVLGLAPGSKGDSTTNIVMGPDDGDDNEYIPL